MSTNTAQCMIDEYFMGLALAQASLAADAGEVPVGAVLVAPHALQSDSMPSEALDAIIISQTHNCPITSCDPTAHAEVQALRLAASRQKNYRLDGTTLYVTLEPCTMCVGALVHARVQRVVFAASEPKAGALHSARALMATDSGYFNHRFEWQGGVLAEVAAQQLTRFFQAKRQKKR